MEADAQPVIHDAEGVETVVVVALFDVPYAAKIPCIEKMTFRINLGDEEVVVVTQVVIIVSTTDLSVTIGINIKCCVWLRKPPIIPIHLNLPHHGTVGTAELG